MNIISATILRHNFASALKEVDKKKDYLLVAKKGKIHSAIVNIDLFEDLLELADKNYVLSIKQSRKEYEKGQTLTHAQVFGDL